MRMAFGVLALLVALLVMVMLARHQLAASPPGVLPGATPASGSVAERAQQTEQRVASQVDQLMQQRTKQIDDSQP